MLLDWQMWPGVVSMPSTRYDHGPQISVVIRGLRFVADDDGGEGMANERLWISSLGPCVFCVFCSGGEYGYGRRLYSVWRCIL